MHDEALRYASERIHTLKALGGGIFGLSMANLIAVKESFQTGTAILGFAIAAFSFWKLLRGPNKTPRKPKTSGITPLIALGAALLLLGSGCTFARKARGVLIGKESSNTAALTEERRAMTTGAADAIALAPPSAPTALAAKLTQRAQQIDGLPQTRIDVPSVLSGDKAANDNLASRLKDQDRLIAEKDDIAKKLSAKEAELIEMGQKYEAERNQNIFKRVWHSLFATLGIGGIIALCVFCPPAAAIILPIFGRLLGWIVAKAPGLASYVGVVATGAMKAVVKGVAAGKDKINDAAKVAVLHEELSKNLDSDHKALVKVLAAS